MLPERSSDGEYIKHNQSTLLARCRTFRVKKCLLAPTANDELGTFSVYTCGGYHIFTPFEFFFGIVVENEKNAIFNFPVKIRNPFSISKSTLKSVL